MAELAARRLGPKDVLRRCVMAAVGLDKGGARAQHRLLPPMLASASIEAEQPATVLGGGR